MTGRAFKMNVSGAFLRRTDFSRANLEGANLSRADFTGAIFVGADLKDAILEGTVLVGADLTGVRNLTASQLSSSIFDSTTKLPSYLKHSDILSAA